MQTVVSGRNNLVNSVLGDWRDGSVKSIDCSSRGSEFKSQHPHGDSKLSVIPVLGDPTPPHRDRCRLNTSARKIKMVVAHTFPWASESEIFVVVLGIELGLVFCC